MHRVRRFVVALSLLLSGVLTSFTPSATVAAPFPTRILAPSGAKITITKHPGTVRRGATASVAITTAAKASCSITVRYKSGPSKAQGLGPKQANASGVVSWSWKVGTRTTSGSWPVIIACNGQGTAQTVVRVP
jgi:hypothetical protein